MKYTDLELFVKGQYKCIPTDSKALNATLGGGLRTDNFIVIQGPSGIGKTTFLLRLMYNIVNNGEKCMFISGGEQDARELFERFGCLCAKLNYSRFIEDYDPDNVTDVYQGLSNYGELIEIEYSENPFEMRKDGCDMDIFLKKAKELGIQYIIYDYLGSAISDSAETQYSYLTTLAGNLKNVATNEHLCIITAMQTNRAFKEALKDKKLDPLTLDETFMSDSIGPARKASVCITLCKIQGVTHLVVFKNRLTGTLEDHTIEICPGSFKWLDLKLPPKEKGE